jgi:hypothetical protein
VVEEPAQQAFRLQLVKRMSFEPGSTAAPQQEGSPHAAELPPRLIQHSPLALPRMEQSQMEAYQQAVSLAASVESQPPPAGAVPQLMLA